VVHASGREGLVKKRWQKEGVAGVAFAVLAKKKKKEEGGVVPQVVVQGPARKGNHD